MFTDNSWMVTGQYKIWVPCCIIFFNIIFSEIRRIPVPDTTMCQGVYRGHYWGRYNIKRGKITPDLDNWLKMTCLITSTLPYHPTVKTPIRYFSVTEDKTHKRELHKRDSCDPSVNTGFRRDTSSDVPFPDFIRLLAHSLYPSSRKRSGEGHVNSKVYFIVETGRRIEGEYSLNSVSVDDSVLS